MAVTTEPQKYTAGDGREFDDKGAAEAWDALNDATDELQAAAAVWERTAIETATTADGKPFKLKGFDNAYWQIFGGYDSAPRVCEVRFSARDVRLPDPEYREDVRIEYVWRDPWAGQRMGGGREPNERRTVYVSNLYASQLAARLAAHERNVKRLVKEYATAAEQADELGVDGPPALGPRTCDVCCWSLIASGRALPGNTCQGCKGKPSRLKLALGLLDELAEGWGKAMAGGKIPAEAGPDFLEVVGDVMRRWSE